MAVADVQWSLGSAVLYMSSGPTVTVYWAIGSVWILHEYIATAMLDEGHLTGGMIPLGGGLA